MILRKSILERKSRLSETVLSFISGTENMRIGAASSIVSLNIGPSENISEYSYSFPLSSVSISTCIAVHMLWEIPKKSTTYGPYPQRLLGKESS